MEGDWCGEPRIESLAFALLVYKTVGKLRFWYKLLYLSAVSLKISKLLSEILILSSQSSST